MEKGIGFTSCIRRIAEGVGSLIDMTNARSMSGIGILQLPEYPALLIEESCFSYLLENTPTLLSVSS